LFSNLNFHAIKNNNIFNWLLAYKLTKLTDMLWQSYTAIYFIKQGMISEENLIEICTISLTCSNQDFIGNISTILTDPLNYPQLLKVIDNPYVAFSFCLAIKNKLKKDKDS